MADCGRLYRQRQELVERQRLLGDAAGGLRFSLDEPDWTLNPDAKAEAEWRKAADIANNFINQEGTQAAIRRGLDDRLTTDIAEGQPTNYRQLLNFVDEGTAEAYANLHQLLMKGHEQIDPKDYQFLTQDYGRERVLDMVAKAYEGYGINGVDLKRLSGNVAPFLRLVENMTRVRVGADALRSTYLKLIDEAYDLVSAGMEVPQLLKGRIFRAYKMAVVGERHFDLARRRTGQTLRSLQDMPGYLNEPLQEFDVRVYEPDLAEAQEILGTRAADVEPGQHVAQVMEAIADGKARPKRGARKLKQLKDAAQLDGLDPRARFKTTDDWINHNLQYAVLLAKDSMLMQLRSHLGLNLPSNALMALYGPYRQAFENVGMVTAYGHKLTRGSALQAMDAAWSSFRTAMSLTRANVRSLYMDALMEGRAFYGNNQDLATITSQRLLEADQNDLEIARMRQVVDLEVPLDSLSHGATRLAAQVLKANAAFRLFLHDQFGLKGPLLQPGLRNMVAADNVGGFFFHAFSLLNDLQMQARFRGAELGLETPAQQMEWVMARFQDNYTRIQPSERDILEWREANPDTADALGNDEIAQLIADERVKQYGDAPALAEYGVPRLDSPEAQRANTFSREMRFQNVPTSAGPKALYQAGQTARRHWWAQVAAPFFQAPFVGSLMDFSLMGDPIAGVGRLFLLDRMTPRQRSRAAASWVVSTQLLGLFLLADMADGDEENLIIGNGVGLNPQEREEWEAKLRAAGRAPNTVGGVPVAGIPLLNTLMLWKDVKDSLAYAAASQYDNARFMEALLGVMTGHLMRMPGVAQLKQVIDMLTTNGDRIGERAAALVGFQSASYAIPGVGAMRQLGASMQSNRRITYGNRGPTVAEQEVGIDWAVHERLGEFARNFLYGAAPFTQRFPGGVRKMKDHLGQPLRIPWGAPAALWLQDRFGPQAWPEGAKNVYAQLDLHNKLRTPQPLLQRELDGVRMNDELQEEYRAALAETKGRPDVLARLRFMGMPLEERITAQMPQEIPGSGLRRQKSITLAKVPLHGILQRHIVGKTRYEAFQSLFNDPAYRELMAEPATTADPAVKDRSPAARRRTLAGRIVNAIDAYYLAEARNVINLSGSPAAAEWRERRRLVEASRSIERVQGSGVLDAIRIINRAAE